MPRKIFVGLSGGVDSAVSAALLAEQGFDVTGVFVKIWQPEFIECTWREDRLDAMRVCAALDIPFREIDLSAEYKKEVVDTMVADYARGITPNPDVLCNSTIKFGALASWAKNEGADALATGHYAQRSDASGHFELLRGRDAAKDQSYFLYRLKQSDLARTYFPIGGLSKVDVRKEATRRLLPVATKPDSQGLCFIGEVSMRDFLSRYITLVPGPVVDETGARIGEHDGAALYTIGQRHGFTTGSSVPQYVVGVDIATNTVRVSARREDGARISVHLTDVSWVHREAPLGKPLRAQARYHEKPVEVTLSKEGSVLCATFAQPHIASSGQSLVIYDGDTCLGGGVIVEKPSTKPAKTPKTPAKQAVFTFDDSG